MLSRYHTEKAEDYWNRQYLDYADNNWHQEQDIIRILTPALERMLTERR